MSGLLKWLVPRHIMMTVCWGLILPSLRQSRASYVVYGHSSAPSSSPSQHLWCQVKSSNQLSPSDLFCKYTLALIMIFTKTSKNAPTPDRNLEYSFKYPISPILVSYIPVSIVTTVGSVPWG